MQKKTFSGRTLDEALEAAIREYKKPREELNYRILEEKKSLFGLEKRITIEILEDQTNPNLKIFLNKVILNSGLNFSYKIEKKGKDYYIHLEGEDLSYILRNYGEGLDALQYLLKKVLERENFDGDVIVDSGNFRKNIKNKIKKIALSLCKKVKKEGKAIQMKPLPPDLRKIIHLTATRIGGLETKSEGNGYYKRVLISVKK